MLAYTFSKALDISCGALALTFAKTKTKKHTQEIYISSYKCYFSFRQNKQKVLTFM